MQTDLPLDPLAECAAAVDPNSIIDGSKRSFLQAVGLQAAGMLLPKARAFGQRLQPQERGTKSSWS